MGGLACWAMGITGAPTWRGVLVVLSLLPAIGAFLVWAPVAVYLLITGEHVRGVILLLVGALVISPIDNLLRPRLVGKDIRLSDDLVLVSPPWADAALFGMNGFVVGPLIAALFVAVWSPLSGRPPQG